MSNIVRFEKPETEPLIWRCDCGCITHLAHEDGTLECAQCGAPGAGSGGEWRRHMPEPAAEPKETEDGDLTVTSLDTSEMALKRVLKTADPETLAALIAIHQTGRVSCWGHDFDTLEQAEWLERRFDDVRRMLKAK